MTAYFLVAVPDVFGSDGTVRRGVLDTLCQVTAARARIEADLIGKSFALGLITRDEARALESGR